MTPAKPRDRKKKVKKIVGWREMVGLPGLGIDNLAAKVDTGARTAALHAEHQERFERDGKPWVRFSFPSHPKGPDRILEALITDEREIRNTGGVPELRLIIHTTLLLGRYHRQIDMSLADRKMMEFDLILGRAALRLFGVLVNPGRSYLMGQPLGRPTSVSPAVHHPQA